MIDIEDIPDNKLKNYAAIYVKLINPEWPHINGKDKRYKILRIYKNIFRDEDLYQYPYRIFPNFKIIKDYLSFSAEEVRECFKIFKK